VGAAEIRQPRDHHTRVGDRLLKRCEIDAWIAGRVMCDGRQRVTIGLRDVEHVRAAKPTNASSLGVFDRITIGVDVSATTRDRGENRDTGLTTTDPAPKLAPRLISGDAGGGGALRRDQTLISEAVRVKPARRFKITDEGVAAAGFERGHECGEVLFREFVGVVCVHESPPCGCMGLHAIRPMRPRRPPAAGGDVARRSVHARLPAFCWLAVRVRRRAWVIDQGATRAPARDAHDAQV
jgi:hypothetical protein